jgi:hypothetical protein
MKKFIILFFILCSQSLLAQTLNGFEAQFYGFIKTSAMFASEGLASFNNINLSAATHAVAQTRAQDRSSRTSFQTQQSRLGINLKKGEPLTAKLEFDFIDFNKSSPTTQMVPRVRIASVTYASGDHKFIFGQDWDLFSPVTSYTFDYVGLYFLAGNTGFMRQQAQYLNTQGKWEFGTAVGMAGNNPGTSDSDLELAKSPTYALRISRLLEKGRAGISGIYAHLDYETSDKSSHDSYGLNAFYESLFERLGIKSEIYYGQNLANIGSLSLGKGTATSDPKEFGGTLTATYKLTDLHSVFGGVGFARIDKKSDLTPFTPNPSTGGAITAPGIRQNTVARLGWDYRVMEDFSWVTELSRFETDSKLTATDYQLNVAYSLESGIQLRF